MKNLKENSKVPKSPASTATFEAGKFLGRRRVGLGGSMRRTGRELGICFNAWRNIELGIKPPGRTTLLKVLFEMGLSRNEIRWVMSAYYEHDRLGYITEITKNNLSIDLSNA